MSTKGIGKLLDILPDPAFLFETKSNGSIVLSQMNQSSLNLFGNRFSSYLGYDLDSLKVILPKIDTNVKKTMEIGIVRDELSWKKDIRSTGKRFFDQFRVSSKEFFFLVDFIKTSEKSVLMIAKDVTKLKEEKEELRESAEFNFGLLAEYSPLGMIYLSTDGKIKYLNPASTRQMGLLDNHEETMIENLVGKSIFGLPNIIEHPEIVEGIRRLLEGEPLVDLEITMKNKKNTFTAFGTPRFAPDGTVTGAVFMYLER